mmetsp:Transcript_2622/g.7941  ORF Transcript_2622/g.7941 Transcript_2622/m.7941 type:complete len:419 (-) Transcript_2622:703-1959(-)
MPGHRRSSCSTSPWTTTPICAQRPLIACRARWEHARCPRACRLAQALQRLRVPAFRGGGRLRLQAARWRWSSGTGTSSRRWRRSLRRPTTSSWAAPFWTSWTPGDWQPRWSRGTRAPCSTSPSTTQAALSSKRRLASRRCFGRSRPATTSRSATGASHQLWATPPWSSWARRSRSGPRPGSSRPRGRTSPSSASWPLSWRRMPWATSRGPPWPPRCRPCGICRLRPGQRRPSRGSMWPTGTSSAKCVRGRWSQRQHRGDGPSWSSQGPGWSAWRRRSCPPGAPERQPCSRRSPLSPPALSSGCSRGASQPLQSPWTSRLGLWVRRSPAGRCATATPSSAASLSPAARPLAGASASSASTPTPARPTCRSRTCTASLSASAMWTRRSSPSWRPPSPWRRMRPRCPATGWRCSALAPWAP